MESRISYVTNGTSSCHIEQDDHRGRNKSVFPSNFYKYILKNCFGRPSLRLKNVKVLKEAR